MSDKMNKNEHEKNYYEEDYDSDMTIEYIEDDSQESEYREEIIEDNNVVEDEENDDLYESFENMGLLEDDYEDYDEVYLYSKRKPKSWKKREHRLWVRMMVKIPMILIIIGGIVGGFFFGFRLKNVVITGNYAYSDEEILAMLNYDRYPKNSAIFWWENRKDIEGGIPFIEKISVHFGNPSTVYVNVAEKMIIGCINDGGLYMYFDNTGTVVESSTSKTEGIALVTGLTISNLEIGDQLDINDASVFNNLYELSVLLKNYELTVDQIDYRSDQTMVMHRGSIKILLGTGLNLEDKINAYKDLEPNLEGMSGKLYLEDYDSSKNSIFFSKES